MASFLTTMRSRWHTTRDLAEVQRLLHDRLVRCQSDILAIPSARDPSATYIVDAALGEIALVTTAPVARVALVAPEMEVTDRAWVSDFLASYRDHTSRRRSQLSDRPIRTAYA